METIFTSGQLIKLIDVLAGQKVDPVRFQDVLESGYLADIFDPAAKLDQRAPLREALGLGPYVSPEYPFSVDYYLTLDVLAEKAQVELSTPNEWPVFRKDPVRLCGMLIHYERTLGRRDIEKDIKERGWRHGTIQELLSFWAQVPEILDTLPEEINSLNALGSLIRKKNKELTAPHLVLTESSERPEPYWLIFEDVNPDATPYGPDEYFFVVRE